MSQSALSVVIILLLIPLWSRLKRDFVGGLAYATVLLVSMTPLLRIPTPGALPEITIHRLVLLSLVIFWFRNRNPQNLLRDVPLAKLIFFWALVALVSLVGANNHVVGIKRYLDYVLEFFVFYFIVATTLQTREDALKILRAACIGLSIVALLAFAEKYTGINVVDRYIAVDDTDASALRDVRSTYRHRILLGTGMAMAWPVALYFWISASSAGRRRIAGVALLVMVAACYFARSRGPWLAAMLAAGVLFLFGSSPTRRRVAMIGCFAGLLLLTRPGVFNTIAGLGKATLDRDSFKGGTFQYRLELWSVAASEVSRSPWRMLFGYGPGSGATQSVEWSLSYRDRDESIWSWDNDFAYALYQYGFLGLAATIALYGAIAWRLLSFARQSSGSERDLFVCLGASTLVLVFMMSNVMIFARQLHYLLWALTAIGFFLKMHPAQPDVVELPPAESPLEDFTASPSSRRWFSPAG